VPRNRYFNCLTADGAPLAWNDLEEVDDRVWPDSAYFGRVFKAADDILGARGLTFYLTSDTHRLPEYGNHVVAVVCGNESCRVPAYVDKVAAVFQGYGKRPRLGCRPVREPSLVNLRTLLIFFSQSLRFAPSFGRYILLRLRSRLGGGPVAQVYEVPVGTFNQADVPEQDFESRAITLFFGGSVKHGKLSGSRLAGLREVLGPKAASRREMLRRMQEIAECERDLVVETLETPSYGASTVADEYLYSKKLMNTKISLVPRGTSPQTFRFFQSLRAGCVVITDTLPSQWFFQGSPAIVLHTWSELPAVVSELLAEPAELKRRHRQSLNWWDSVCSEEAVGRYVAERSIAAQPNRTRPGPFSPAARES
jgi:hypothetical protein